MATIYSTPEEVKAPNIFDDEFREHPDKIGFDYEKYNKAEEKYLEDLKAFLIKRKKGKNVGEIIGFPVADGKALYMVASIRPLELVHIPLGDAYQFQYAHRLTAKDVDEEIRRNKAWGEFVAKKQKEKQNQ